MRIKYPKAIQESEEDLTSLEQGLRGQKAADRVRMLRLLKSGAVKSLRVLRAPGRLQCEPADALVGMLPGRGRGLGCSSSTSPEASPPNSLPKRGRA